MTTATLDPVYDKFLNFVLEKATPNEVLAFEIPEETQARAVELLEKANSGELTATEQEQMEQLKHIDLMLSILKVKALAALKNQA